MPFELSWEKHGFYSRFWGKVPKRDIEAKNRCFSNDSRSDRCSYQIFDGTDVEAFVLSKSDITAIAGNDVGLGFYLKNLSVVLIGSKPEIRDVYQQYVSTCTRLNITWKFHICDTIDQSREWLRQQDEKILAARQKEAKTDHGSRNLRKGAANIQGHG